MGNRASDYRLTIFEIHFSRRCILCHDNLLHQDVLISYLAYSQRHFLWCLLVSWLLISNNDFCQQYRATVLSFLLHVSVCFGSFAAAKRHRTTLNGVMHCVLYSEDPNNRIHKDSQWMPHERCAQDWNVHARLSGVVRAFGWCMNIAQVAPPRREWGWNFPNSVRKGKRVHLYLYENNFDFRSPGRQPILIELYLYLSQALCEARANQS